MTKKVMNTDDIAKLKLQLEKLGMDIKIDFNNIQSIVSGLLLALTTAVGDREGWQDSRVKNIEKDVDTLKKQQREVDDSQDAMWQRNLKGNFIINSPDNPEKGLKTELLTDDQLKEKNITFTEHVIGLVKEHYDVDMPSEDISACHRLKNGAALLKVWNRKNESAYQKLVGAVRSGGKAGAERKKMRADKTPAQDLPRRNVFICFHMTRRRSELIKKLKSEKKAHKITRFSSNQNGSITMTWKPLENGPEKSITITRNWDDIDGKTYTPSEIDELIRPKSNSTKQ